MKRVQYIIVGVMLVFQSCTDVEITQTVDNRNGIEQIKMALQEQQACWNKGDLDGFMATYWNNDSLMFISGEKVSFGWQKVLDNYKKSYHSPELMGQLEFEIIKMEKLSSDAIMVVGSWQLIRESTDIGGKFSLLWRDINGEWKIVIDHTS